MKKKWIKKVCSIGTVCVLVAAMGVPAQAVELMPDTSVEETNEAIDETVTSADQTEAAPGEAAPSEEASASGEESATSEDAVSVSEDTATEDTATEDITIEETATELLTNAQASVWDGSVDLSWYDPDQTEFHLTKPAQLAGLAAIVNGRVSAEVTANMITGDSSILKSTKNDDYLLVGAGGGSQSDTVYVSDHANSFVGKTIYLEADMDMGGVYHAQTGTWSGPNWTPIGGRVPMDVKNASGDIYVTEANFNGTIDGQGHKITNLYCDRYTPKGYAYSQSTGFVGFLGNAEDFSTLPSDWNPGIRNLVIESGYVRGRRMVGGLCGGAGKGITIENCANKADVFSTDSRGIAGILAEAQGSGVVRNCYNLGNIETKYTTPASGIVGSNGGVDIYNCYNAGKINATYGRGIGSHSSSIYRVENCYCLEGMDGDAESDGYYEGTATSISVSVTQMPNAASMQDASFANSLNANGQAFVARNGSYPVLFFEDSSFDSLRGTTCSVQKESVTNGTLNITPEGTVRYGTVVNMSNKPDGGYICKNYSVNGTAINGDFYLITGDSQIGAEFISLQKGPLRYDAPADLTLYTTKSGSTTDAEGNIVSISNAQVFDNKDLLYQNDTIKVIAVLKNGAVPADDNLEYTGDFTYTFTYKNGSSYSNSTGIHVVKSDIEETDGLVVSAQPKTQNKNWLQRTELSWYTQNKDATTYELGTPEQLAGLAYLVDIEGVDFAGKTIRLSNSISLKNTDGSSGIRYWTGIGTGETHAFKGIFDGCGYTVSDMNAVSAGTYAGLFGYCVDAAIKNVAVRGEAKAAGRTAGVAAYTANSEITNCTSYVIVNNTSECAGGIVGKATTATKITDCMNYGTITSDSKAGGIVGESTSADNQISQCGNYGKVSCGTQGYCGGIVGNLYGSILSSTNKGEVASTGRYTGGIAGYSLRSDGKAAVIDTCYNTGKVTSTSTEIGGIVGYGRFVQMNNCYNGAVVSGSGNYTGAVMGLFYKSTFNQVSDCFYLKGTASYGYNVSESGVATHDPNLSYVNIEEKDATTFEKDAYLLSWEKDVKMCVVTFSGAIQSTQEVRRGQDAVLPASADPSKQYGYSVDGKAWDGKAIIKDVTVAVTEEPATYYVTFIADDQVVEKVPFSYGQTSITEPSVPVKNGSSGVWSAYEMANKNIAVHAVYSKNTDTIAYGDSVLQTGEYDLAANASGTITIAAGADVALNGNGIAHNNLGIVMEEGARLTIKDLNLTVFGKAIRFCGDNTLIVEGNNSLNSSAKGTKINENPAISVEGDTSIAGTGILQSDTYEPNATISIAEGCTFTLKSGTLMVEKGNRFGGASGGVVYAPKGNVVIDGGIFASVSHTDNVEAFFVHSFTLNDGLVYAASLDTSAPVAIFAEQIAINGGSLKAETRSHTTGTIGSEGDGIYTRDNDVIYQGTIEYRPLERTGETVAARNADLSKYKKLTNYTLVKAENLHNSIVEVDGKPYYTGSGYEFGYDVTNEIYTDKQKDPTLYMYLKPGSHKISVDGVITETADTSLQGVCKDPETGKWYYYVDGIKQTDYTGFQKNAYGFWYVSKGAVDFTKTDVMRDLGGTIDGSKDGWWYVKDGKVQLGVDSVERNAYGWWRIVNGKVDFFCNSVERNSLGWWYIRGGKVDFSYTGVAKNSLGWWRIVNGKVDFSCNSVEKNELGWWYIRGGKVDFGFTGIGSNRYGSWYVSGGKVNFGYSGYITYQGRRYRIINGRVS